MKLTIDIGNTRKKWALFEGDVLVTCGYWDTAQELPWKDLEIDDAIGCCVGDQTQVKEVLNGSKIVWLSEAALDALPIKIAYKTRNTLGMDRVAAACGAWKYSQGKGCVIVDAGTCITIDYVDANGVFQGGAIMPGISMQLRALHRETAKLPEITKTENEELETCGKNTQESILAGTQIATIYAIEGFIKYYMSKCPLLEVVISGGDARWISKKLKTKAIMHVDPNLVMKGMNDIMLNKVKREEEE